MVTILKRWLNICNWVSLDVNKYYSISFTHQPATYNLQRKAYNNEDILDLVDILRTQRAYRKHPLCNMDCILMGWQHGLLDISVYVDKDDIVVGGIILPMINETIK